MVVNIRRTWPLFFVIIPLIAGCGLFQSTAEKMYERMEKVVSIEDGFKNEQERLIELEKKEKEIYDEILSLGMKDRDKIARLSDEAAGIAKQREECLEKERESMIRAEEEFKKLTKDIEKLDDEKLKKNAEKMYDTMMKRYELHEELYRKYKQGIAYDRELYAMFKEENVKLEDLEDQINKINGIYHEVIELNGQFNKQTEAYNEAKVQFYKDAGLDVKTE
ncbi:MAG: hypothetical protein BAA03_11850 [Caldibacillus debilis]|nr:MAG: hypothetical protein BAA03_11850 [Caldibacillus debilis]